MGILSNVLDPIFASDTSKQDKAAKDQLLRARAEYNIDAPDLSVTNPNALQDLGGYNPDLVSAPDKVSYDLGAPQLASNFTQGDSAYGDISTDPRLRSNQENSLSALNELAANGGHNAQDEANLARDHSGAVQDDRARRDAISQQMGARGMSGSGMDLLSKLQSSQAATDRESQYGLDVAGQGQDRALQAIMQSGQLSGQMQGQDFNQQAQQAAAKDAINQFNTTNSNANSLANANISNQNAMNAAAGRLSAANSNNANTMSVNSANQNAKNAAGESNSANSQRVSDSNVANMNTAQSLRDKLPQQNFDNLTTLASGKAGADTGLASSYQQDASRMAAKDAGYMGAAIQGGAAVATGGGSIAASAAAQAAKKKQQEGQ